MFGTAKQQVAVARRQGEHDLGAVLDPRRGDVRAERAGRVEHAGGGEDATAPQPFVRAAWGCDCRLGSRHRGEATG